MGRKEAYTFCLFCFYHLKPALFFHICLFVMILKIILYAQGFQFYYPSFFHFLFTGSWSSDQTHTYEYIKKMVKILFPFTRWLAALHQHTKLLNAFLVAFFYASYVRIFLYSFKWSFYEFYIFFFQAFKGKYVFLYFREFLVPFRADSSLYFQIFFTFFFTISYFKWPYLRILQNFFVFVKKVVPFGVSFCKLLLTMFVYCLAFMILSNSKQFLFCF